MHFTYANLALTLSLVFIKVEKSTPLPVLHFFSKVSFILLWVFSLVNASILWLVQKKVCVEPFFRLLLQKNGHIARSVQSIALDFKCWTGSIFHIKYKLNQKQDIFSLHANMLLCLCLCIKCVCPWNPLFSPENLQLWSLRISDSRFVHHHFMWRDREFNILTLKWICWRWKVVRAHKNIYWGLLFVTCLHYKFCSISRLSFQESWKIVRHESFLMVKKSGHDTTKL